MVTTYCTVDDVANVLGHVNGYFDANSTPTSTTITNFIERAESRIESRTGHAWREVQSKIEYIEPSSIYRYGTGIKLNLIHRSVRDFVSGTDKIEVWNGNEWEDWIQTRTEGRNKDYWIDYTNGVVYLVSLRTIYPDGVRISYKYGETIVSHGIEEAAALMAAIMVLSSPEYQSISFTDDGGSNRLVDSSRIQIWTDRINSILDNNQEFHIV